jgi:hypothetical protein
MPRRTLTPIPTLELKSTCFTSTKVQILTITHTHTNTHTHTCCQDLNAPETIELLSDLCRTHNVTCPPPTTPARLLDKLFGAFVEVLLLTLLSLFFFRCPPHARALLDKLFGAFVEGSFSFTAQFTCFTSTKVPLRMRQGACRAGALAWWANNIYYIFYIYMICILLYRRPLRQRACSRSS